MSSQLQVTGEAKIRDIQGPVVANSGVITALDGAASQYVRGDGTLADFPTSSGGGSSVSYYLNSSVSQGTIGGVAYRELSKEPIIGAGTDIVISANGYVASYLTDANDPDVVLIPGGNFNCEFYFSVNNNTGNPFFYAELYKYDGTTFTLLGSSVGVPEYITQGTTIAPYYFAIPVATATLALTDRLAIRIYVNVDGRTVTLHTENGHLCQVVTTLSKGMVSLNNLTDQSQFLTVGTSGTNFNIVSSGDTHTFNLPIASATNTGKLSSTDWSTFNGKVPYTGANANVDLGANSLFAYDLFANGNGTNNANLYLKQGTPALLIANGYSNILATGTKIGFQVATSAIAAYYADLQFSSLTAQRTYTLPDVSGQIAILESPFQVFTGTVQIQGQFNTLYGISMQKGSTPPSFSFGDVFIYAASGSANILKIANNTYESTLSFPTSNQTYTFPAITGTLALLEGTQTFTGKKTFSNGVNITGDVILSGGTGYGGGIRYVQGIILAYGSNETTTEFTDANSIKYYVGQGSSNYKNFVFDVSNVTLNATRTYNLPDASGTIALTSDLGAYVTLATTQTISGSKTFSNSTIFSSGSIAEVQGNMFVSNGISFNETSSPAIFANALGFSVQRSGTTSTINVRRDNVSGSSFTQTLAFSNNAANRTYTFPDATGTVALTSNLSAYLPLAGGTLTGNLNFTAGANINLGTTDNFALFLRANNTNILTLFPSGNAGINAGGSDTGERFQVTGTTRLNGALSGTSATFSGRIGTSLSSSGVNFNNSSLYVNNTANTKGAIFGYDDTNDRFYFTSLEYGVQFKPILFNTSAATFSSSVTANSFSINSNGTLSSNGFWGTLTTKGAGSYSDWSLISGGGNGIMWNPTGTLNMSFGGNVGIGTNSPGAGLEVVTDSGVFNALRVVSNRAQSSGTDVGIAFRYLSDSTNYVNGGLIVVGKDNTTSGNQLGNMQFYTNGGSGIVERMRITSAGNVNIAGSASTNTRLTVTGVDSTSSNFSFVANSTSANLFLVRNDGAVTVSGSLSKGSGSFKIDHPLESMNETHNLVHSFVESPQANNIYRGKVELLNGKAKVNLDEVSTMTEGTFVALNREIHTYTSNETDWDAVRGNVKGNILTIECQNNQSNAIVSWLVIGERQDKHMMDTTWTDDNGRVIVEPLKEQAQIQELKAEIDELKNK
jgi:hypothetical protein